MKVLIKIERYIHQIFFFCLLLLAFTSAGVLFLKLLELHSTISEKNIFVTNFPFVNGFAQTPLPHHTLSGQNPLSVTKVFLSMLPTNNDQSECNVPKKLQEWEIDQISWNLTQMSNEWTKCTSSEETLQ